MSTTRGPSESHNDRYGSDLPDESFRLLVHSVRDYAIFMMDPQGVVVTWNSGAERIKGYRAEEIIGRHFSSFYPEEDIVSGKPARELEIATTTGRFEEEGWRLRNDGTRFWASVVITALFDDDGSLRGFGKVTRDMTERIRAEQALQNRRKLFNHLVKAQEMERRRIAWDVHDDSIQAMIAVSMRLQLLSGRVAPDLRHDVDKLTTSADAGVERLRNLVFRLRPPELDSEGLVNAIESYARQVAESGGFTCRLHCDLPSEPSTEVSVTVFRIVQEALANVQKHARASTVEISLRTLGHGLRTLVRDDGAGADLTQRPKVASDHFGFADMLERAEAAGGWWKATSEPGQGMTVDFWVPTGDSAARLKGAL